MVIPGTPRMGGVEGIKTWCKCGLPIYNFVVLQSAVLVLMISGVTELQTMPINKHESRFPLPGV
jgi:hypothetical protein